MHLDAQLMLEALAIQQDVFTEDLYDLRKNPQKLKFPHRLTIRESAREKPVFSTAKRTQALTVSGAQHHLAKARNFLGWKGKSAAMNAPCIDKRR